MDFKKPFNSIESTKEQVFGIQNGAQAEQTSKDSSVKIAPALFYILAFCIPVLIMLIVYICIGIFPFGEKTLLTIDLYHQYIDFFSYYRQSISSLSFGNFFYSFSKTLGGNMIGLYAYYLASPFNLFFLLFKSETLAEGVLLITLLKIGTCGITFGCMCRKMFKTNDIFVLIFSTCYALMAYNIVFQQNLMWLDGVIWLPIIMLGIYNIVHGKGFKLYAISLCIALLSNYYIGYMICIFSVLFFIYLSFVERKNGAVFGGIKMSVGRFILASALAGGMAAVLLVPTFIALRGGKATFDLERFSLNSNFEFTLLLQKLFVGEMDISVLHQGLETTLPDIFCGTVITALCFLYFANKKISFSEKIASIIMMFILIMSFHIKALNLIWHGMSTPVGFLYRNSFVFSFFAIYIAFKAFTNKDDITKNAMLTSIGIFIAMGILESKFALETLTDFEIYMTIAFFIGYMAIIKFLSSSKKNVFAFIAFMLIVAVEAEISGCLTLELLSHVSRETYVNEVTSLKTASARLQELDKGLYRFDKTYMRSRNDGMMHGYKTLTHSSSTADFGLVKFLNQMGFRNESNIGNSFDYGSTLPAESLLSIKYVLNRDKQLSKHFISVAHSDNVEIFKNPYALPIMFKGRKNVLSVQDSKDILQMQNDLFTSLSNSNDVLKKIPDVTMTTNNITKSIDSGTGNYAKNDTEREAYIEFKFSAINDDDIYAHFPTEPISDSTVEVYVNDELLREHLDSDHLTYYDILNLGSFEKGEEVKVKFVLQEDETNFENYYFYALDSSALEDAYEKLTSEPMDIEMLSNRHIKATVENVGNNELVFTSIPFDSGWKIYVDGKETEADAVLGSLIAIDTGSGNHTIEMKYTPPGLILGLIISGISIFIMAMLSALSSKWIAKRLSPKNKDDEA